MSVEGMYVQLVDAVDAVAEVFDGMYESPEVFRVFSCQEIEKLAGLMAAVGQNDTAARIVAWHAAGDDEGDEHFAWDSVRPRL